MPNGKPRDKVYWVVQERKFVTYTAHKLFRTYHAANEFVHENKGSFKIDRVVLV
jgi:hypothetical protein